MHRSLEEGSFKWTPLHPALNGKVGPIAFLRSVAAYSGVPFSTNEMRRKAGSKACSLMPPAIRTFLSTESLFIGKSCCIFFSFRTSSFLQSTRYLHPRLRNTLHPLDVLLKVDSFASKRLAHHLPFELGCENAFASSAIRHVDTIESVGSVNIYSVSVFLI